MYNIQNSRVIIILKVMTFKLISKRTNRFLVGKLNVSAIPIFKTNIVIITLICIRIYNIFVD